MHPVIRLLSRNVRRLRLERGMAPKELAKKAGVSTYVLGRIETGKSNPGIDVVFRLARALDVHPADMFISGPLQKALRRPR